jgi:hypothetical protein
MGKLSALPSYYVLFFFFFSLHIFYREGGGRGASYPSSLRPINLADLLRVFSQAALSLSPGEDERA